MTTQLESGSSKTATRKAAKTPTPEPESPPPPDDRSRLASVARALGRIPIWGWAVVALLVVAAAVSIPLFALSGGRESDDRAGQAPNASKAEKQIAGSYVGKASKGSTFIAVVVAPPEGDQDRRQALVYVADGRSVSEWFSGSMSGNSFVVKSADGDAGVEGKLSRDRVKGTVELENGKKLRYVAARPGGAAGLYDLKLSRTGKLRGASAAGLAVKGQISLEGSPAGVLKLADGRRLELEVTSPTAGDVAVAAGRVRLIVLPDGDLAGSVQLRSAAEGESSFFLRLA